MKELGLRLFSAVTGSVIVLLMGISLPTWGWAQEAPLIKVRPAAAERVPATAQLDLIHQTWEKLNRAGRANLYEQAAQLTVDLQDLSEQVGFAALEGYALELIGRARLRSNRGDWEASQFFLDIALILAPDSPRVLFAGLDLSAKLRGPLAAARQLGQALFHLPKYPEALLLLAQALIYPFLWALTFAQIAACLLLFVTNVPLLLRGVLPFLPAALRGLFSPVLALLFLGLPCFFGPFWCVGLWALAIYLFLPLGRRLLFSAALVLLLWGAGIYAHESIKAWLADDEVLTMLRLQTGSYSPLEHQQLQSLAAKRPTDGVVAFMYGQALRRRGEYAAAAQEFSRAQDLLGADNGPALAAQGVAVYFTGDLPKAAELFAQAEAAGLSSGPFFLFYSKIKADLSEFPASQEYFARARSLDPAGAARLLRFEERQDVDPVQCVPEIKLPVSLVLKSVVDLQVDISPGRLQISNALTGLPIPLFPWLLGAALLIFAVTGRKPPRVDRFKSYYPNFQLPAAVLLLLRLVPGAAQIMSGRHWWGLLWLLVFVGLVLPLIAWPAAAADLRWALGAALPAYALLAASYYLLVVALSWQQRER